MKAFKGRLCVTVDLDQQGFTFMTPQEIREQVRAVVDAMGAPEGGLMLKAVFADPNTPLRNIAATAEAMEEFCFP